MLDAPFRRQTDSWDWYLEYSGVQLFLFSTVSPRATRPAVAPCFEPCMFPAQHTDRRTQDWIWLLVTPSLTLSPVLLSPSVLPSSFDSLFYRQFLLSLFSYLLSFSHYFSLLWTRCSSQLHTALTYTKIGHEGSDRGVTALWKQFPGEHSLIALEAQIGNVVS